LEYITAILYVVWLFSNFVVIWYIFPRFGILCQEKSGIPAQHRDRDAAINEDESYFEKDPKCRKRPGSGKDSAQPEKKKPEPEEDAKTEEPEPGPLNNIQFRKLQSPT
jgi:hypothetical protein